MTVRELIEKLQELPGELEVYVADSGIMQDDIALVNRVWAENGTDYIVIEHEPRHNEIARRQLAQFDIEDLLMKISARVSEIV